MAASRKSSAADDATLWRELHVGMLRIRRVEERLSKLFADREIPGFIHLSIGQESVPVGVSRHLRPSDTVSATHRGHGHALAKGLGLEAFFAEMMGKDTGVCRGRGGSMHIADAAVGMLGANGIVGGGMPIATGSALAHQIRGRGDIAVCYFGDGALAEGVFHECLNLSALWQLPCLYVCENNGWGEFSRTERQFCGRLEALAGAFGIAYRSVDGIDAAAVATEAGAVIERMRARPAPAVLECRVTRFHGHFEGDPQKYRDPAELAALDERDPLAHARRRLAALGVDEAAVAADEQAIEREIEAAVAAARAAEAPSFDAARRDVYAASA